MEETIMLELIDFISRVNNKTPGDANQTPMHITTAELEDERGEKAIYALVVAGNGKGANQKACYQKISTVSGAVELMRLYRDTLSKNGCERVHYDFQHSECILCYPFIISLR